eukprot:3334206-Pyramimonas_sp.AAC.1
MSHPVSSTTGQSQHETLIPLSSYPDSQRKDLFGRGTGGAPAPFGHFLVSRTCHACRALRACHG